MPAPKGNKYYLQRSKSGREKEFKTPDEFFDAFLEYIEYCDNNPWAKNEAIKSGNNVGSIVRIPTQRPYTRKGFASYVGMTEQGIRNYGEIDTYKDFFDVYTRAMEIIDNQQLEGAMVGTFNAHIVARVQGIKEAIDHTTGGNPINITVVENVSRKE